MRGGGSSGCIRRVLHLPGYLGDCCPSGPTNGNLPGPPLPLNCSSFISMQPRLASSRLAALPRLTSPPIVE
ncbi:hypothetical protein IF1G_04062 [Cordyceps javanica]|uniref:Uncharacterized protein n=1 Tax=Cordyceps javanica TaxID=43265 RepID=A0A545V532_9HYPO|nr:hypothetical protein IF1G_04062 [Cordyceps javanica]